MESQRTLTRPLKSIRLTLIRDIQAVALTSVIQLPELKFILHLVQQLTFLLKYFRALITNVKDEVWIRNMRRNLDKDPLKLTLQKCSSRSSMSIQWSANEDLCAKLISYRNVIHGSEWDIPCLGNN